MRAATKLALAVVACAVALATAAALPAVWWEPLHLDERVMLEYAPDSPGTIVREVFVDRGGAPLQFLVEHVTLQWPGGLAGLRLPSFVFFLLALGFSWPVAWLLVGERAALALPLLLASAPLAVELATFGRMYALFLWLVLAAAWLALRAGRSNTSRAWIAAGALAGGLVYV
ncbi:MAG TPA: glycosyltransferase family 39 protein, partial [Gaiellaceae bacterium]|nr:glycosyltransferase family 39 protein [Gaiellaceae bacterium]